MARKMNFKIFGPLTGLIASILMLVGELYGDINPQVSVSESSSSIAAVLIRNESRILTSTYLIMLGVFFLVLFVSYLRQYLLSSAQENDWLINASFGGGLLASAMLLLSAHFKQSFTVLQHYGGETQVAKTLYLLDWNWYLLVEAPAIALLVGATSLIGLTRKALPRWLSVSGILLSLLLLMPYIPGSGVILSFLWIAMLSITLLLKGRGSLEMAGDD